MWKTKIGSLVGLEGLCVIMMYFTAYMSFVMEITRSQDRAVEKAQAQESRF